LDWNEINSLLGIQQGSDSIDSEEVGDSRGP